MTADRSPRRAAVRRRPPLPAAVAARDAVLPSGDIYRRFNIAGAAFTQISRAESVKPMYLLKRTGGFLRKKGCPCEEI